MAVWWRIALIGCILSTIVLENVDGRGSRSSSKSVSRSRVSTRYGSLSGTRTYTGSRYQKSYWGTGAAVGVLYGLSSYKRRRRYLDSPRTEPTICFNEDPLRNGTYGFFICPEPDQADDYNYCCGEEWNQECCQYFDSQVGKSKSAIAGIIAGVIVALVVIGIVVFFLVRKFMSRRASATSRDASGHMSQPDVQYTANSEGFLDGHKSGDTQGSSYYSPGPIVPLGSKYLPGDPAHSGNTSNTGCRDGYWRNYDSNPPSR